MEPDEIGKWREAGRIAAQVLDYGARLIVPGASAYEVAEAVEAKARKLGAEPAFPVNLSCDHIAAHYTAIPGDTLVFGSQVVKIDIGVHIDGYIGDTARTVDLSGTHADLVAASEEALAAAIGVVRAGVTLAEIGRTIHAAITARGFSPIKNLSGHGIERFDLHAAPTTPNYDTGSQVALEAGRIVAIEPFATDGTGLIQEGGNASIFSQVDTRPVRDPNARQILRMIADRNGMPFAERWIAKSLPTVKTKLGLRSLLNAGVLKDYAPLPEVRRGTVSQAEHTLLVTDEGCEVLTLLRP
ncbi:type II methionyl aminopeptidase [Candidatus Woesearchaeota archaeon]|nr:type II methionyl aminopeptidase [Candidatus Woesearchaeota archaeon]